MLTKILIFAAVVIGVFVVARMGASSAVRPTLKRRKKSSRVENGAEDLVACPVCGAYVPRGEACSCGGTPTP